MTKQTIEELEAQVKQLAAERDAVVAESARIQKRMQQLIDIINKADNSYCMCGEAMKNHGHGGCGHPTGMLDYHYGRWSQSEYETPATHAILASLRAEGVEMFVEHCKNSALVKSYDFWMDASACAESFATQLRSKSAESTSDIETIEGGAK